MFRFVGFRIFWLRQPFGYAAAVPALIGLQEFRNVENVIRSNQLVDIRCHEVQSVMALEPLSQFGRNLEAVNKPIARRNGVLIFYLRHDFRITVGENVKRELPHRFRARRRRRDAGDHFECARIALRSRPAHKGKGAQRDAHGENGWFPHAKIVTEMENQQAEVPARVSYSEKPKRSLLSIRLGLSALGSVLEELGELFNFFGFLHHAEGEHVGGRGFLNFFAQLAGELVKLLDPLAEFLLVLPQHGPFCSGGALRVGMNLRRVRRLRGPRRWRRSWRKLRERPSLLSRHKACRRGHRHDKHTPRFKHTGPRIGELILEFLPTSTIGQCLANSRKRMALASPARINPAKIRKSREEGIVGMGPGGLLGGNGGSRTPTPVRLRGGPPPRTEETCGSRSGPDSVNSYGIRSHATPRQNACPPPAAAIAGGY